MSPAKRRIAVIGGVAAGTAAAAEAKRQAPEAEVVLFEKMPRIAYGACEMPYYVAGRIGRAESLVMYSPERFEREKGVKVYTRNEVRSIDPKRKKLTVAALDHHSLHEESYDQLILAVGAQARRLGIAGEDAPNLLPLRRLEDAVALRRWLETAPVNHVVVIGGGYIGLEVAEAIRHRRLRATVLEPIGILHDSLDEDLQRVVAQRVRAGGVTLRNERPVRFEHDRQGNVSAVWTDRKEKIGCQLVVVAIGITPNLELAQQAGIAISKATGALAVGSDMKTNVPNIWACGDCVEVERIIDKQKIYLPLSPVAFRTARVAARNAARRGRGEVAHFPGVVGGAAIELFGLEAAGVGLTLKQAQAAGFDAVAHTVQHWSRSKLYPGAKPLWVRLVAERGSGRLLGGQLVGDEGAALRADVLVPLLRERYTLAQVLDLDLLYTPPVAPAHDPLLVASVELRKRIAR